MKISDILTNYNESSVSMATPIRWCTCGCTTCGGFYRGKVRVDTSEGRTKCDFCHDNDDYHDEHQREGFEDYRELLRNAGRHENCEHCENCNECMTYGDDQYACIDGNYCSDCYSDNSCNQGDACPECDWCTDCRDYYDNYSCTCNN